MSGDYRPPPPESGPTRYYHGGVRGLGIGARILPPSVTGATSTARYGNSVVRADRVYVTTDFAAALLYAAATPVPKKKGRVGGWIYTVDPVGELTPDPDCFMPGLSFECEAAIVVGVTYPTAEQRDLALTALLKGDPRIATGGAR